MRDHAARQQSRSRTVLSALLPSLLPWCALAAQARPALQPLDGVAIGFDGAPAVPAWAWVLAVLVIAAVDARRYLDLHRAAGRRQQMERQLQELGDNLPAVVYQAHVGRTGRLELGIVAGDARQLFDLPADTLRQHPQRLLSAVLPEGRRRLLAALARAKRSGQPVSVDFRAKGVHGVRTVSMRAWPVPGAAATCWSGFWIDDSLAHAQREHNDDGRRRAEHEARARDRLLHVLGEGIRAPLRELDGAVAALGAGPLPAAQRSALDALQQATVMLQQIMTEVLEEPVADVDTLPIRTQPTDLPVLLQQVLRLMQPLAQSKGLQLQLRDAPGRAEVVCVDALRLRQVLLNLIGNAIRFTRQGGIVIRVRVVGEDAQQRVRIQVVDSGIGIAPLQQQRVFEPYQQAGATTAAEFGGTGLGLGICRKLVQRMQGELHLHSRLGRGTRVTLELPLTTPAPTPAWNHIPDAQVLVADDHPAHRLLLQWRLQILGLQVLAVADGTQALQAWRGGRFQLLVCDEQMPGLRGSRLAARIRHEERQGGRERVAIIGMSAEPSMARSTHIDQMLGKAATTEELRQVIAGLCPRLVAAGHNTAGSGNDNDDGSADDLQAVLHRLGSPQLSQQLLQTLCDSLQEDILKLRQQRSGGRVDAHAQALTLHRIAGAMGSIGLGSMARWLHDLSTRPQPLPADEHRQVVERLQACLQQWRQLPPPV